MKRLSGVFFLGVSVLLVSCVSPEYRIKKNPELFASFPLEAQELIKEGKIAIGFTPEMVTMALGPADRVYTRETSTGAVVMWAYTETDRRTDSTYARADTRYRDRNGRYRSGSEWVYVDVPRETEYEKFRVEFSDGKVSAIDVRQQ